MDYLDTPIFVCVPTTNTQLAMSDSIDSLTVDQLVQELNEVTEWHILGNFLGLSTSVIKEIDQDCHDTASKRLAMFDKWLRNEVNPSWKKVVKGLEKMSELRLANQLKNKYCKEQEKEASEKPLAERELKIDRNETIAQEIDDFGENYLKLVMRTESALEDTNLSSRNIKRFSEYYMSGEFEVTTVEQLFDRLKPFYFLNYLLLEKIIKFFLSHDLPIVSALKEYIQQLEEFKKSTTVQQFMESIEAAQQPPTTAEVPSGMCNVTLRLMGKWLEKTMEDLDLLVKEIFQDKVAVLTHLKIMRGSVIVTYHAPLSECMFLFLSAALKFMFMFQVGVRELKVGHVEISVTQCDESYFSFEAALKGAVYYNRIDAVRFLLDIHTTPDAAVGNGDTALTIASFLGRENAVEILLKSNANPNIARCDGITPIWAASQKGHTGIVKLLLNASADPNVIHNDISPLMAASKEGYAGIVKLLLNANANPNVILDQVTPLFVASHFGHSKVVSLLLKFNADPNYCQNLDNATSLLAASQSGHSKVVSLLLKAGVNPNQHSKMGVTALSIASLQGHCDVVNNLLKAGANPNLQDHNGFSPLHMAAESGHSDVIKILLNAHADPNLRTKQGRTPLVTASTMHHHHTLELLLTSGADANIPMFIGITPLMVACFLKCLDCAELLLMYGADPNMIYSGEEVSILHLAASLDQEDIVDLLQAVKLSQSSSTLNVLTAAELAADVDNEALSVLNRNIEKILVEKTESLISTLYSKYDKSLPPKFKKEVQRPVI